MRGMRDLEIEMSIVESRKLWEEVPRAGVFILCFVNREPGDRLQVPVP